MVEGKKKVVIKFLIIYKFKKGFVSILLYILFKSSLTYILAFIY